MNFRNEIIHNIEYGKIKNEALKNNLIEELNSIYNATSDKLASKLVESIKQEIKLEAQRNNVKNTLFRKYIEPNMYYLYFDYLYNCINFDELDIDRINGLLRDYSTKKMYNPHVYVYDGDSEPYTVDYRFLTYDQMSCFLDTVCKKCKEEGIICKQYQENTRFKSYPSRMQIRVRIYI